MQTKTFCDPPLALEEQGGEREGPPLLERPPPSLLSSPGACEDPEGPPLPICQSCPGPQGQAGLQFPQERMMPAFQLED